MGWNQLAGQATNQTMDWNELDWRALERLRANFLAGGTGGGDYWQGESDLASYDATFAQRIGWKWDYVFAELARRGWSPPRGEVLDWGCGSGIAGRAFLDHFGVGSVTSLRVWDRSAPAMQFAQRRAREKYPQLTVNTGVVQAPAVLLLSHVLTELDAKQTETLAAFAATAQCVLWVEPGTRDASRVLLTLRERLRASLSLVSPCPHQARCGLLTAANERHWCHHFAVPPPGVFLDGNWSRFADLLGIDLRDLPLSFLVLDRRPAPSLPAGGVRIIGRPRVYKAHALLLGCEAEGVREQRLNQRSIPDEFRRLKKGTCDPLQIWRREGDALVEVSSIPSSR